MSSSFPGIYIVVIYVALNRRKELTADLIRSFIENAEKYLHLVFHKKSSNCRYCDLHHLIFGKAVGSCRDKRQGRAFAIKLCSLLQCNGISLFQQFFFSMVSARVYRPDHMNNILCIQIIGACCYRPADFKRNLSAAFFVKPFACCMMYRVVNAAVSYHQRIGRVDQSVCTYRCYIFPDYFKRHTITLFLSLLFHLNCCVSCRTFLIIRF